MVTGDLADEERCDAVRGCDAVVHLAAVADVNKVRERTRARRDRQRRRHPAVLEAAVTRASGGSSTRARSGCTAAPTATARSTRLTALGDAAAPVHRDEARR